MIDCWWRWSRENLSNSFRRLIRSIIVHHSMIEMIEQWLNGVFVGIIYSNFRISLEIISKYEWLNMGLIGYNSCPFFPRRITIEMKWIKWNQCTRNILHFLEKSSKHWKEKLLIQINFKDKWNIHIHQWHFFLKQHLYSTFESSTSIKSVENESASERGEKIESEKKKLFNDDDEEVV